MMSFIFSAFAFHYNGEAWWKAIIPLYKEYTMASLGCVPMAFWPYLICYICIILFTMTASLPMIILSIAGIIIFYSIILISAFFKSYEKTAKIFVALVFMFDVGMLVIAEFSLICGMYSGIFEVR